MDYRTSSDERPGCSLYTKSTQSLKVLKEWSYKHQNLPRKKRLNVFLNHKAVYSYERIINRKCIPFLILPSPLEGTIQTVFYRQEGQ